MTRSNRRLSTPDAPRPHGGVDAHRGGRPVAVGRPCGRSPASTERCTSSATFTSSRKTSTEPASARDISSRSPTMRWKRRRSSLRSCRARWERGGRSSRSASSTSSEAARVVSGERSSWLTSELNRASRSMRSCSWSTMALNELGQALEVGIGRVGVEAGVEVAAGDGARRPRHVGQRAQRARAGEAAQGDAEDGGDDAGTEERQPEHAEGVVEVRQVEHLEVERRAPTGPGTPTTISAVPLRRAVGLGGRGAAEHVLAQLRQGWTRR